MDLRTVDQKLNELEQWIRQNQDEALRRYAKFANNPSLHSFHANIGRNNNTFVDSVRTRFAGPQDFIARWVVGLHNTLDAMRASGRKRYSSRLLSEEIVLRCLQDDKLREYTFFFLERNFYRNFRERTRNKPDDALWSVWFGSGNLSWGLIIAPAHRNDEWTNDKSQMRREHYTYWTLGHVLSTGFHDPASAYPMKFNTIKDFATFYRSVLKRVSNSLYEQAICDRYLNYIDRSMNPFDEPFLIPEFRYAGKDKYHEFRLDFTVLNGHTFNFTGFELSPSSTHIRVQKAAEKTQVQLNSELADAWEHEVQKRNAYFQTYGINVVTFADKALKDIDACFAQIEAFLRARDTSCSSIDTALNTLMQQHGLGL